MSPTPSTAAPPADVAALLASALGGARMEFQAVDVDEAIEAVSDRAIAERMALQLGGESPAR